MEKLDLQTPNFTDENIKKLAALFPNCVTESRDDKGRVKKAIDFDLLKQELTENIVDGPRERYQINWPGKRESLTTANTPINKTLRPCREESVDFDTTQNLYIEGDNLEALKLLQESYLGKVKMIYIDPPYNTGKDFVYKDNFAVSKAEYELDSEQRDKDGRRLVANPDSNGRYHSDWLSMMYPRLKLARNLLKKDGVIFISIDDGEQANVKKLCDEIFGEQNFQANVAWQKRYTRSNNTVDFTTVVEHIIVYSKSSKFIVNLLPRSEEADARYTNTDKDKRGVWKGASFLNPATPSQRPNLCYPIENPNTGQITHPTTNAWRRSKEEYERLAGENRLYWGIDGSQPVPSVKMFLFEARGLTPVNFWEHGYAGNTDQGTAELQNLLGSKVFDNPKPSKLIYRCLEHGTNKNDITLDFFAGSGTTAHAVMQLNVEDNGNRKFIMVQLPEPCDEKSEAFKADYKTIAEISKDRIRRAGQKIKADHADKEGIESLEIGFRVLKVANSNMNDVYYAPDDVNQDSLKFMEKNIKDDRTAEDLLFHVLLDWGLDLSAKIVKEEIQGKVVYFLNDDDLAACFDDGVNEALVKALAKRKVMRVVFKDTGFAKDEIKDNVEQIFKQLSPETEVRAI
ncbi:MAG: site-specific DNA-methyltransferase [Mariprofundaceae bacterium]|nr:site-specific DNA-methyltransferase [Mariprofundaceae bacterium]